MSTPTRLSGRHLFLLAVLFVAFALRLFIVLRGGNYYWADEQRYESARHAATALWEGKLKTVARELLGSSDHIGFRWIAMVPAVTERALLKGKTGDTRFCSGFFALFSVLNLFLVWRIAERVATSPWEPPLALVFAASSTVMFFYARHCFPYDASLTFFLLAALVSVSPATRWQSVLVGLWCGAGYLTYNGYWSVGAVVLVLDVLWRREGWRDRMRRAALGFAGLVAPIGAMFAAGYLAGTDLIADSLAFSNTVNQGDFNGAWQFPAEYLRIADGPLWMILGVVIAVALVRCASRPEYQPWLRWVAALVLLYAIWVTFCDILPKFVLYGRTVRAAVPFLALAAAGAFELIRRQARPVVQWTLGVAAAFACLGGMAQMRTPLQQTFPPEFQKTAATLMAEVHQREPGALLRTMFADYLSNSDFPEEPPPYRVLLRRPHPHQYLPYLYEGIEREQRPSYYGRDISMRVIQLDTSRGLYLFKRIGDSRWLAPHPGPLAILVRLPKDAVGATECVLRAGDEPEKSDRVLVHYLDSTHIRVGWSHGGEPPQMSEPLDCDYAVDHAIGVSLGTLFPPENDARFRGREDLRALCRRVALTFDGQSVFSAPSPVGELAPVPLAELALGGFIPAGTDGPRSFTGKVYSTRQIDPRGFLDEPSAAHRSFIRGPYFGDRQGPIELSVRFPSGVITGAEPIVSTGHSGAGDLLYVSYQSRRHVRFHLDHWGTPSIQSGVMEIVPGKAHQLVVSFGSLMPAIKDVRYEESRSARKLIRWLYVSLDGRVVFSRPFDFYACDPDEISFGSSFPGGTACAPTFGGEVLEAHRVQPDRILSGDGIAPEPEGSKS